MFSHLIECVYADVRVSLTEQRLVWEHLHGHHPGPKIQRHVLSRRSKRDIVCKTFLKTKTLLFCLALFKNSQSKYLWISKQQHRRVVLKNACTHARTHAHTHTHTHTHIHTHARTHARTRTHTHTCYNHTHVHTFWKLSKRQTKTVPSEEAEKSKGSFLWPCKAGKIGNIALNAKQFWCNL